jgi:hypothetical protein
MKRVLGTAVVGVLVGAGGLVLSPAPAQNASQCLNVDPPGVPNNGVLAVGAGLPAGSPAVRCSTVASTARPLYWGARTANAWDITGTRMVNGQPVVRLIASGRSAVDNDGTPNGGTFNSFAGETLTVTIHATCTQGVCVAEGMAGVGG